MKIAPGTITHRLHGIITGRVVTLTCEPGERLRCQHEGEPTARRLMAETYPAAIAEMRLLYGSPGAIGSVYLTTTAQALAEAAAAKAA